MRHAEKKKEKDKIAIVLMLCFCVIALTSIFTIRSSISKINDSGSNVPVSDRIAANPGADPAKPSQNPSPNAAEDKKSAESSARIRSRFSRFYCEFFIGLVDLNSSCSVICLRWKISLNSRYGNGPILVRRRNEISDRAKERVCRKDSKSGKSKKSAFFNVNNGISQ